MKSTREVFRAKAGRYFGFYIVLLSIAPIGVCWLFIQHSTYALLATCFILLSLVVYGKYYTRKYQDISLLVSGSEWRVVETGSVETGSVDSVDLNNFLNDYSSAGLSNIVSLDLPVIRLPGCILMTCLSVTKQKKVLIFWSDTLGQEKFRALSRLLSREEFLINRS
ncbi:MAG: hypothetical protein HWE27_15445 [Gammaproteobacteria bacterium]|nr:hypothetical protein [Gammaproteobacteria bacterium]